MISSKIILRHHIHDEYPNRIAWYITNGEGYLLWESNWYDLDRGDDPVGTVGAACKRYGITLGRDYWSDFED